MKPTHSKPKNCVKILFEPKRYLLGAMLAFFLMIFMPGNVQAACCLCATTVSTTSSAEWKTTIQEVEDHIDQEFSDLRDWMINDFWENQMLPALMEMAEQLTAVAMQQVAIVGTFLDAKHQLETQQVIQKIQAQAHKDYSPSNGVCEFGSSAKSLAASERKAEFNALLLSQRSQDRSLGHVNTAAATGDYGDKKSRIKQFREKFCDPADNNNGLGYLCDHDQDGDPTTAGTGATNRVRMNKDIDYVRTVEGPWTLDVDFTDAVITDNEEEIIALANNLYGHNVMTRPPAKELEPLTSGLLITNMQKHYLDMRSVIAKRSVAENSFNAITALKSAGTPGSGDFLRGVLSELGVPAGDINTMVGINPSYHAQMEVLTKKIYQNPDFYTNLYDKPANVSRKGVAIQGIALMQKFDLFKSYLRNEASLSVLLELAVMELQDEVETEIAKTKLSPEPAN